MSEKPEYFTEQKNDDGSSRYYWTAPPKLRPLLKGTGIKSRERLPDDRDEAYERCRAITAEVKGLLGPSHRGRATKPPAPPKAETDKPPGRRRLSASRRLLETMFFAWRNDGTRREPSRGVYAVISQNGWIKIGNAQRPMKRLEQLQTASPLSLSLLFFMRLPEPLATKAERRAHRLLAAHALRGEWFGCHWTDAIEAVLAAVAESAAEEFGPSVPEACEPATEHAPSHPVSNKRRPADMDT